MGFDTIHETSLQSICDILVTGLKTGISKWDDSQVRGKEMNSFRSIAKASRGLILEYPIIVSKANHIESAGIVAKAYEAKFVTMLQILFSAMSITNAKSGFEYLRNFHTNLDYDKMTVDKFIDLMDSSIQVQHASANMTADYYTKCKAVLEDMKNLNYYFEDDIKEFSLNNYKVMDNYGSIKVVREAPMRTDPIGDNINNIGKQIKDNRDQEDRDKQQTEKEIQDDIKFQREEEKLRLQRNKDEREEKEYQDNKIRNQARDQLDSDKFNYQKDHDKKRDDMDSMKFRTNIFQNQLLTSDVKKANELTPTMLIINFNVVKDGTPIQQQMIIGVKAKLYEVEPIDVINKIITKNVDSNVLLKLVKLSTREISFVKDFLLAIDDAKLDALSKSKRGSANKLFKVLERRSLKGKLRRQLKQNDYCKAISSLVISQEEAEELLKNNIDVNDPRIIRPIMEKLNLISFAIIDESSESVKFLFDTGDDVYETIPLSKLEKEQKDGMSKKVINLMAKMNR